MALVSGVTERVVFTGWTVSSFLGPTCKPGRSWIQEGLFPQHGDLGGPPHPTHSGRELPAIFGHMTLNKWLSLSASTLFRLWERGTCVPGAPALRSPRPEDECHPQCFLEPRPHLPLGPFLVLSEMERQKPPVCLFSLTPLPRTSVHRLPSDPALPTPSLP